MKSPPELTQIIKAFEGFRPYAYPDPGSDLAQACARQGIRIKWGYEPARRLLQTLPADLRNLSGRPWTVGYGETAGVNIDSQVTEAQAAAGLATRLAGIEADTLAACTNKPNENQLIALVSFAYNIGPGGLRRSTVLKAHNRGDYPAAARAFGLWNKAGGRIQPGLVARRAQEAAIYMRPIHQDQTQAHPLPPADPERDMTKSTINRASVAAGGTATIATVAETARLISDTKTSLDIIGEWAVPVLLALVVALCAYIVWERIRQRREGWA